MLISDLAEALLRDYTINRRKSLKTVKSRWETHLRPFFHAIPAESITSDQVEAYIALRLGQKAENGTVNRELAALKRLYSLAIRSRKLSLGECPYIPHLTERNVRRGFLRDIQYAALAAATLKQGLWLRAMFELGYIYGWRKTELLGMKVRQLDLREQTITLDAGETKNDDARIVVMTAKVLELLRECAEGKGPDEFVFTRQLNARGAKIRKLGYGIVDMRRAWAEATRAADCPGLLFHDLRRTAVRNLIRHGVPEKVAMQISGHRTRSVFDRYHIIDPGDIRGAADKLDKAAQERHEQELFDQQTEMFEPKRPLPKGKVH